MYPFVWFSSYTSQFNFYVALLLQHCLGIDRRYILKSPQNLEHAVLGHGGGKKERAEVINSFSTFYILSPFLPLRKQIATPDRLGQINLDWETSWNLGVSSFQTNWDIPFAQQLFTEEPIQLGHSAQYLHQKSATDCDFDFALDATKLLNISTE